MDPAGSLALVTGASAGIGRATARMLAARGARLLVAGRDPGRTAEVAATVGGEARVADLADPAAVASLADDLAHGDPPDLVVHNAGVGLAGTADATSEADLQRVLQVNLLAPMRLTAALLPRMRERGSGRIVFVTSIAGLLGVPREAAYAASKAALGGYAASLRDELAGSGVGVTTVAPGIVGTGFFDRRGTPLARSSPRPVTAEQVARALVTAVQRDRAEVVVPRWLRLPVVVRAAAPQVYAALSARFAH